MNGKVALFLAVAGSLAALSVQQDALRYEPERKPSRCCLGQQWSANMTVLNTATTDAITVIAVQMDFDRQQQVMFNYTLGSPKPNGKTLLDFTKGLLYVIPVEHPESYCYKIPFNLPLIQCIPDDAEYLASSYLGPLAGNLPYDAWRFKPKPKPLSVNKSGTPPLDVVYTLAVSKEGCVPLVQGSHYPGGYIPDQLFMYSNFQPKLTDPSAFILPDICFK